MLALCVVSIRTAEGALVRQRKLGSKSWKGHGFFLLLDPFFDPFFWRKVLSDRIGNVISRDAPSAQQKALMQS
jgi:hypothetical protein